MNWLEQIRYVVEEVPAVVAADVSAGVASAGTSAAMAAAPVGLFSGMAERLVALMPSLDSTMLVGLGVTGTLLVIAATLTTVRVIRHNRELGQRLARLELELTVYTEASTRVAQSLEAVLLGRTRTTQTMHTSRRYLLLQARDRLHRGESPQGIARGLGLSHDEVRLLEHARLSNQGRGTGEALSQQARTAEQSYARPVSVELPEAAEETRSPQQAEDRQWNVGAL